MSNLLYVSLVQIGSFYNAYVFKMQFSNDEKTDMMFVYARAFRNATNALQMYQNLYPERRTPNPKIFARIERRMREHGSFNKPQKRSSTVTREVGEDETNVLGIVFGFIVFLTSRYSTKTFQDMYITKMLTAGKFP